MAQSLYLLGIVTIMLAVCVQCRLVNMKRKTFKKKYKQNTQQAEKKYQSHQVAPLTILVTMSFKFGEFLEILKLSSVTPLHKRGSKVNMVN